MITSAEEFVRLRTSDDPALYGRAARESASLAVWRGVIEHFPDMHFSVAHNKTVPIEILAILAGSDDARVRAMVAMKRKIGPDILVRLATDADDAVRMSVARHRNTPREVLLRLLDDEWKDVADVARARLCRRDNPAMTADMHKT